MKNLENLAGAATSGHRAGTDGGVEATTAAVSGAQCVTAGPGPLHGAGVLQPAPVSFPPNDLGCGVDPGPGDGSDGLNNVSFQPSPNLRGNGRDGRHGSDEARRAAALALALNGRSVESLGLEAHEHQAYPRGRWCV